MTVILCRRFGTGPARSLGTSLPWVRDLAVTMTNGTPGASSSVFTMSHTPAVSGLSVRAVLTSRAPTVRLKDSTLCVCKFDLHKYEEMAKHKNQHFVPRCYLRAFSRDGASHATNPFLTTHNSQPA